MQLSEKLLRSFSDIIKSSAPKEKKQNPTVMGTVTDTEGGVLVQIDGSTIKTPAVTLVGVEVGDRVDVLIQNHRAVITGNRTAPAITRYGKTYTKLTDDGLIVGILDDNDQPTGLYLLVNPEDEAFQVVDPEKGVIASFGPTVNIGVEGDNRVVIQDDGVHLWGENIDASIARFGTDMIDNVPTPIIRLGLMNGFRLKLTPTEIQFIDGRPGVTEKYLARFSANSSVKRLETDALLVETTAPDRTQARGVFRAYDSGNTRQAEVWVAATSDTKRAGLYDNVHSKWLINSESDGSVVSAISPKLLNSNTYTATAVSTSAYTNIPIASLSTWSMVMAYIRVGNEYTTVTFIQGGTTDQRINFYNNGRIITGEFTADWSNNRLRLRCTAGNTSDYTMVQMMNVYGIFKV